MLFFSLFLSITLAIVAQALNKILVKKVKTSSVVNTVFFFSFLLIFFYFLFQKEPLNFFTPIVGLGALNAVATWFFVRAFKEHFSKTSVFLAGSQIIGIFLSALFLGEWILFYPISFQSLTTLGTIVLSVGALTLLSNDHEKNKKIHIRWISSILGYIFLGGIVLFLLKYTANKNIPQSIFLLSWYGGAFLGSLLPRFVEKNSEVKISFKNFPLYLLTALATVGSLFGYYTALMLAPTTLVLPIQTILNVIGSLFVGLFLFHEKEKFSSHEWWGIFLGLTATVLLVIFI